MLNHDEFSTIIVAITTKQKDRNKIILIHYKYIHYNSF